MVWMLSLLTSQAGQRKRELKSGTICKYCKLQLSSVSGKGTTHLNRHIGYHCPHIPQEDRDRFLATLKNKTDKDHSIFDPVVFRGLIAKYFISAEIAFRKADDPAWREMLNYCQPTFKVVGRQTIRADCLMLYEEEKLELSQKFANLKSHVSLTADLWTSSQNLGYLGVTAHYIDEEFELDIYLDDPRVPLRSAENFDVLAWWKKNSDAYPTLSLMARDFLSIPVSTVSSESAFSAAGRILGKNRTSLSPETLEALVCAKDWFIGFNDEEEGQPLTGQRMFESDEED